MFVLMCITDSLTWLHMFFILLVGIVTYFVFLNRKICLYWKKRNVVYYPASSFFSPEIVKTFLVQHRHMKNVYQFAHEEAVCGFFQFRKPTLLIKCPNLINTILNKDFKYFQDKRIGECTERGHDPLSYHLLALSGEEWAYLRSKLNPAFTGERLRSTFSVLAERTEEMLAVLEREGREGVEAKEVCGRLSMDCIAGAAFRLRTGCLSRQNASLLQACRSAFRPGLWEVVRAQLRTHQPRLFRALGLSAYRTGASHYFLQLASSLLVSSPSTARRQSTDLLDILLALHNDVLSSTVLRARIEDLVASQVFSFFVGGFETTAITMSNALFEIAKHPEVRDRIRKEIKAVIGSEKYSYDNINNLKYLQSVVEEVLRLYPPVFHIQRVCSKDYVIPGSNLTIEKNTEVTIPVLQLHYDPKFFEKPSEFNPDRFSAKHKHTIIKGTYLPFGDGPRHCIGFRFSLIELKLALCRIVNEFDFFLDSKTPSQLTFEKYSRIYRVKNDIVIRFIRKK